MCCLAFAFGQNDLANAASPGLASFFIWKEGLSSSVDIEMGVILLWIFDIPRHGHKESTKVTRAEVNVASQHDSVELYAPSWCKALGRLFIKPDETSLSPAPTLNENNKKVHYDPLRASIIMGSVRLLSHSLREWGFLFRRRMSVLLLC